MHNVLTEDAKYLIPLTSDTRDLDAFVPHFKSLGIPENKWEDARQEWINWAVNTYVPTSNSILSISDLYNIRSHGYTISSDFGHLATFMENHLGIDDDILCEAVDEWRDWATYNAPDYDDAYGNYIH